MTVDDIPWADSNQVSLHPSKALASCSVSCKRISSTNHNSIGVSMNSMQDKTLVCSDCGQEFTFSASEQEFFTQKGFSQPSRCRLCRAARKACLLYTSDAADDLLCVDLGGRRIIKK